MNLNPSHSQTPQFGNNKSQTTAILHREPTYEEMHGKPANFFSNICAFLLIVITVLALSYMYLRSSEKEIQFQEEQSLARQAEYKGVNQ
jgi:hypothetical protein